jgi:hypothetical protein
MGKLRSAFTGAALAFAAACGFGEKPTRDVTPVSADSVATVRASAAAWLAKAEEELKSSRDLTLLTEDGYILAQRHLERAQRAAERLPASERALRDEIAEGKRLVDAIRTFRTECAALIAKRTNPDVIPKLVEAIDRYERVASAFPAATQRRWRAAASTYQFTSPTYAILLSKGVSDEAVAKRLRDELTTTASRVFARLER